MHLCVSPCLVSENDHYHSIHLVIKSSIYKSNTPLLSQLLLSTDTVYELNTHVYQSRMPFTLKMLVDQIIFLLLSCI